jgi:phenylpropionate dioxygenase-like ring-hydroxylating dioxygenase large terminal subunit
MNLKLDPVVVNARHPVASSDQVTTNAPFGVSFLGEDLVLWRGPLGLHTWQDLCLHRGVKLSLGQILPNGQLRCAYHGWTYDESGQCIHMPAHPSQTPPPQACAKTFPCREDSGLVWVSLSPQPDILSTLPEAHDSSFRSIVCGPYPSSAGAPRLIENFLDVAHLPIVHDGTLGCSDQAGIAPYEIDWIEGKPVARDIQIYQPNPEGLNSSGRVSYEYGILSPFVVYLRKRMDQGRCFSLLFAVTPITENTSTGWFTIFLNYGEPAQDGELRAFQSGIFAQDQPIVASQRPEKLPLNLAEELHLPSDRLAIAYRKYIRKLGLTFGTA